MNKRPLRKLAGLLVLYVLIFFVIIVIQFKNETIINETFGPFHIILSETKDEDNNPVLKNNFQITVGEITFFADSASPAKIIIGDNEENLTLNTWKKKSNSDFILFFNNDVYIEFEASEENSAPLRIHADMPSSVNYIVIPYTLTTTADVETMDSSSLLLTGRELLYKISAAKIDDNFISLSKSEPLFSITEYVEETQFSFDTIAEYELAQAQAFNATKSNIQKAIIELFPENPDEASFSEKVAITWVAEMAAQDNYKQALTALTSYAKNSVRTYISTPYFNSLAASNRTLTLSLTTLDTEIRNSLNKQIMNLLLNDNFVEKSVIIKRDTLQSILAAVKKIIDNQPESISSKNATAILTVFHRLKKYGIQEAQIIEPYVDMLVSILESCASLDEDDNLVILNGTKPLEFMDRIKTGFALLDTGIYRNNNTQQAAGRLLINSTLQQSEKLSLDTVADLYPLFITDNHFYPHIEVLEVVNNEPVWAWTITENMSYTVDDDSSITIKATFPQNEVHHTIIRGIKKFNAIDIYGISYRTDPRFESYNSSGYVFESDSDSLLLKYRHRSQEEEIKLYYK